MHLKLLKYIYSDWYCPSVFVHKYQKKGKPKNFITLIINHLLNLKKQKAISHLYEVGKGNVTQWFLTREDHGNDL